MDVFPARAPTGDRKACDDFLSQPRKWPAEGSRTFACNIEWREKTHEDHEPHWNSADLLRIRWTQVTIMFDLTGGTLDLREYALPREHGSIVYGEGLVEARSNETILQMKIR